MIKGEDFAIGAGDRRSSLHLESLFSSDVFMRPRNCRKRRQLDLFMFFLFCLDRVMGRARRDHPSNGWISFTEAKTHSPASKGSVVGRWFRGVVARNEVSTGGQRLRIGES
jgi:hypothetical protein